VYYPYPYTLHSYLHQRTHLCEAIWSQYYMRSSRNMALSSIAMALNNSKHFLIPCRFAAPPQVARRHSLYCLPTIYISKNRRRISFTSLRGLFSVLGQLVVGDTILCVNTVGYRARNSFSFLMDAQMSYEDHNLWNELSKPFPLTMTDSPSPLRAMGAQLLTLSYIVQQSLSATGTNVQEYGRK
jgi:hypothetical protein